MFIENVCKTFEQGTIYRKCMSRAIYRNCMETYKQENI